MGTVGMATPEATLAELVAVALLAAVAEAHHALTATIGAFYWMEDWSDVGDSQSESRKIVPFKKH